MDIAIGVVNVAQFANSIYVCCHVLYVILVKLVLTLVHMKIHVRVRGADPWVGRNLSQCPKQECEDGTSNAFVTEATSLAAQAVISAYLGEFSTWGSPRYQG